LEVTYSVLTLRHSLPVPRTASLKDRWRLPLILLRVHKGLLLRGSDAVIYEQFAAGKSQAKLIETIAQALRSTVDSQSNVEDLQRVAHSIILEPQSPFPAPRFRAPSPQTLPQGFVQSVMEAEEARQLSRLSTPASLGSSTGSEKNEQSNDSPRGSWRHLLGFGNAAPGGSAASSGPSSCASSRDSSRAGSRAGSFSASPDYFAAPQSPGVGFRDVARPRSSGGSFSTHLLTALMSGHHSPVPKPSGKSSPGGELTKPPLGQDHTSPSVRGGDDDDEGLLGVSIDEGSVDVYPTAQVKPKGGHSRLDMLRARRRTFDTPVADQVPTTPPQGSARTYPGHKVSRSDDAASGQHVRSGSGGTLSALFGRTAGTHRVVPDASVDGES
jgi:hypothetical protein